MVKLTPPEKTTFRKPSLGRVKGLSFVFINPLTANVPHHIETSQLVCNANQLTGF